MLGMILAAASGDVVWVLEMELLKIVLGLTVGAILLYARTSIIAKLRDMKTFIADTKAGLAVLASEDFRNVPAAIRDLVERVTRIEQFVGPNGGASIIDGIRRLQTGQDALHAGQVELHGRIESVAIKDRELADAAGVLMWKSDPGGNCIWASVPLQHLVGYDFDTGFAGQQWENLYFPEDFPTVQRRWEEAMELAKAKEKGAEHDLRRFGDAYVILSMRTRYRHAKTGAAIPVYFKATRTPDGNIIGVVTDLSVSVHLGELPCKGGVCLVTGERRTDAHTNCGSCGD